MKVIGINIVLLFIVYPTLLFSQKNKAGSIWLTEYGNAIDFKPTPPTLLTGNKITYGIGRISTMSDEEGNLLLYTSGDTAWNRHHQVISNGGDLTSVIGPSPLTSVIVPHPGDGQLYYIFIANKADGVFDYPEGLHYSVVDIAANDGKGQVIEKKVQLLGQVTSLLTVVSHADEKSFWLLSHKWDSRKFYAYHISENGISAPVISTIGEVYANYGWQLKVSPDGTKLALANHGECDLFNFNSMTGVVSDFQTLGGVGAIGVEFSPNSELLYVSTYLGTLHQYDLGVQNISEVVQSGIEIGKRQFSEQFGDLQLAYNGKIYTGLLIGQTTDYLSYIDSPDTKGIGCKYVHNGLKLPYANIGNLPLAVQSFYRESPALVSLPACTGASAQLRITSPGYMDSVQWDFGDGHLESYLPFEGKIVQHVYIEPGNYSVKVKKFIGNLFREIETTISVHDSPIVNLGVDTVLCAGEQLNLGAGTDGTSYLWSTGEESNSIKVQQAGTYKVMVSNGVCVSEDEIRVDYNEYPLLDLGPDQVICDKDTTELILEFLPNYTYKWSTGAETSSLLVTLTGNYTVTVNHGRCATSDEVHLRFANVKFLTLDEAFFDAKYGEDILLEGQGLNVDSWRWNFGDGYEQTTDTPHISYKYKKAGHFKGQLLASNSYGCADIVFFEVNIPYHLFIPNVFTPNNDGVNDSFEIQYNGMEDLKVLIYNRWGEVVFSTNTLEKFWNGSNVSSGTYYYNISAGNSAYKGWVSILR